MIDSKHLLQQRIMTSEQNATFARNHGDMWRVKIELHQLIFDDLGVKFDEIYD